MTIHSRKTDTPGQQENCDGRYIRWQAAAYAIGAILVIAIGSSFKTGSVMADMQMTDKDHNKRLIAIERQLEQFDRVENKIDTLLKEIRLNR